ncbi:uncharacterized protein ACRADG_000495 isoform 1-T1 [Cochliomyia hominivorax]
MRRSKAPSVLNKAKRVCQFTNHISSAEGENSEPEDEQYEWGSRNNNAEITSNKATNKRIFNILFRDISTKKHKTWKGDGTLEVNTNTVKAILKDETGKYLGCTTKFNINNLAPDSQMVIGGKEIEIQNEIVDEDEIQELRKRRVQNRNWGEEEWISSEDLTEEEKKPKGGFKFKPILVLKSPQIPKNVEINFKTKKRCYKPQSNLSNNFDDEIKTNIIKAIENSKKSKEFLCFIRPSELQQFLFEKSLQYYSSLKNVQILEIIKTLGIDHILQLICNHPSFVNQKSTTNDLIDYLTPNLPDWSEMGPFDSGKLEFVQYFLNEITHKKHEKCIIFAKTPNVLNMLQGLCDFMKINCLRLNSNQSENTKSKTEIISEFCSTEHNFSKILLVNTIEILNTFNFSKHCKKLIVFEEYSKNRNLLNMLKEIENINIYYLVTAFSIEELMLFDSYKSDESLLNMLDELIDMSNMDNDSCYVHTQIKCNCFENTYEKISNDHLFKTDWQHFKYPFDEELLKISCLENSAENIITIFCKNLQ